MTRSGPGCLGHAWGIGGTLVLVAGLVCTPVDGKAGLACGKDADDSTAAAANQSTSESASGSTQTYDVVVYGGTSGGVAAAVQVARMGKRALLIEPGRHLGGLTSGGLGATDIGNKQAIGGLAREFYGRIHQHYSQPTAWKYQTLDEYRKISGRSVDVDTMWGFEPHVAEQVFRAMIAEAGVPVVFGQRLDLQNGVDKQGTRIVAIRMESGRCFRGRTFIDATYEGDLMAKAGVSYSVGRESNATYGETLNGVQKGQAKYHQFIKPVDPYVRPGDPSSGLLPGVHGEDPGAEGQGDHRVQAYCYRLCMTDEPAIRRPWPKPEDYDPKRYELLLRNFEAGDHRVPWLKKAMPNRKTDTNNKRAISTDNIGMNYEYPDADYARRAQIIKEHESYQKGLMWTLANHPRVPQAIRELYQTWALAKDEFLDNDNWPHQLYVREARRMKSEYVMTEHNCRGTRVAEDPVGLGAYGMDSHHTQRYVTPEGHVRNEGDVEVGGFSPYPISYRSIVPKADQCTNLLVPVCVSASHIAYGSIRMEPVFMVLGQSAATAAVQAVETDKDVQAIGYPTLRQRLLADKQVLVWIGPRRGAAKGIDPGQLPGVVVDECKAAQTGSWATSTAIGPFVGSGYLHDGNQAKGATSVRFEIPVPRPGRYELRLAYTPSANRATNVPVTIEHAGGTETKSINQREKPILAQAFVALATYDCTNSKPIVVTISNKGTDGYVVVDAVQLLPVK